MTTNKVAVTHDHSYCSVKKVVDPPMVAEKHPETTTLLELGSSHCLSPTYSNDSGIDSFANDLAQEFSKENEDLINFLLDDQGFLEFDSDDDKTLKSSTNGKEVPKQQEGAMANNSNKKDDEKTKKRKAAELYVFDRQKKNAENAKENRRKRKAYVSGLEKEVKELRTENTSLIGKSSKFEKQVHELQEEVNYLKSVIGNESMLSQLLQKVSVTPGISLSTSFCPSRKSTEDLESGKENAGSSCCTRSSNKRPCVAEKESTKKKRTTRSGGSHGGICLHVKENKVSLEFCRICSKDAED